VLLETHACHELENTGLGLVEENSDLIQTVEHLGILADCAGHTTSKSIAQIVIDVQFAWRTGCEESIVQA